MPNDAFDVELHGVGDVRRMLERLERAARADGDLKSLMGLATGLVHRYMMGLSVDRPPAGQTGVLPVITGRLKNSFFTEVQRQGANDVVGLVASNINYGPPVERRRRFVEHTVRETERPVNDLVDAEMRKAIR